ncbi:MAG: hypothetical protein SV487_02355 [Thermodesulfobacteriota bacterium]|nr:hypothetical protein [Thermodesulfobacteriota bacterium]
MIHPVKGIPHFEHKGTPIDQTARAAWREKMLAEALENVRRVSPVSSRGRDSAPANRTPKGGLLDVFI